MLCVSLLPVMLRDGVVVRDGVLYSVYSDPDSRGAEAASREGHDDGQRSVMWLVPPTQRRLGCLKGNDHPLTMIWTKARGWFWLKVVKRSTGGCTRELEGEWLNGWP